MTHPVKIACVGEVMIELIARSQNQATLGVAGDTYNTAVYLSRLRDRAELEVSYVTALGIDRFSQRIISEIKAHGIDGSLIEQREDLMPGLYAIDTDQHGERSFNYWRGQSAAKTLFEEPCTIKVEDLSRFDLIYLSGISVAILPVATRQRLIRFLETFRSKGGKVAFDSNYRPKLWENLQAARDTTMAMWAITDIALPSLDDEQHLFGEDTQADVLNRLRQSGVTCGALKRGVHGPQIIGTCNNKIPVFEPVCDVVDSTAAGDSFNSGFLSEYACGSTIEEAVQKGHMIASRVVQKSGAIVALD